MIALFLRWLYLLDIKEENIYFELYVHADRRMEVSLYKEWWADSLKIPIERLDRIYFKTGNPVTKRTPPGDLYHGLLRIRVKSSTSLNRQINGWIEGMAV